MPDRAILHLTRIVEAIDEIRTFTQGMDLDRFLADRMCCAAVAMNFQIIGESARQLTAAERAEGPEIPWNDVVSLRHRISHDYRTVNFSLVWAIVQDELDELAAIVRRMLAARGE